MTKKLYCLTSSLSYCNYTLVGGYDTRFGSKPSKYAQRPLVLDYGKVLLENQQTNTTTQEK